MFSRIKAGLGLIKGESRIRAQAARAGGVTAQAAGVWVGEILAPFPFPLQVLSVGLTCYISLCLSFVCFFCLFDKLLHHPWWNIR